MDMILVLQYLLSLAMLAVVIFALSLLKRKLLRLSFALSQKSLRRRELS